MANISTIRPETVTIPIGYPNVPQPGKISLLWDANQTNLYHKLSPYGSETFFGIKTQEPYFYKYPDDDNRVDANASREFPFTRATQDVERVTKFLTSGKGILWLGKQLLLQTGNAFNETRIYNPASPILGAAMPLSLWAFRPQRNIDISGGLGSIVSSFLGPDVGSIFTTRTTPPPGTLAGALPKNNLDGGKGLLRAGTANKALTLLHNKWDGSNTREGLGLGKFLSNTFLELFGNFIPKNQSGSNKRSDEETYGLMIGSIDIFSYQGSKTQFDNLNQFWIAGNSTGIRKKNQLPPNWKKLYVDENGNALLKIPDDTSYRIYGLSGQVGYSVDRVDLEIKYGDYVGISKNDDWEASDILIQHSIFSETKRRFPSKLTERTNQTVVSVKNTLQKVLDNIKNGGTYTINPIKDSTVISSGDQSGRIGYDRLTYMKTHTTPEINYPHSTLSEYRKTVRVLENRNTDNIKERSMKMASSNQVDGINTLTVLSGDKKITNSQIITWTEWNPYKDDIIAFYFYDVVNDKYIPFRSTIKGLQEADSVNWEELSFIGRADRLYSYGGYNRSLTFNFTIHINSITELHPTWQRINYLMSLTKPAAYTKKDTGKKYTRFMVPPMVMLTIGDMYKNQPIVLGSVGITIPEEAAWETLNQYNSEEWSYLVDYIKSPNVGKLYGQLPRVAEFSINCYLLEKERAITGAAHFGHAPHTDDYVKDEYRKTSPDFQSPSELHKSLIVYNDPKSKNVDNSESINAPAQPTTQ